MGSKPPDREALGQLQKCTDKGDFAKLRFLCRGGRGGTGRGTGAAHQTVNGRSLPGKLDTRAVCDVISRKIYNAPKETVQKLQTKRAQEDIKY